MGNRARLLVFASLLALAVAIPAAIASAVTPATLTVSVGGLKHGRAPILKTVVAKGTLSPFAPGQQVTVTLLQNGHDQQSKTVAVGSGGAYSAQFRIDSDGGWRFHAVHTATAQLSAAEAFSSPFGVSYPALHTSSRGPAVKLFNRLLQNKGYIASDSSRYTEVTGRGVMAFRKVNGLHRTFGSSSPQMFRTLAQGRGGYPLQHPDAGRHAEVSLRRQVLVLAEGDKVFRIYHVSTGAPATPTIRGSFNFYQRGPGYNVKGMFDSLYFHGGYAVHGYKDVPAYPASHGCVRTPIPDQKNIYRWLQLGDPIFVY